MQAPTPTGGATLPITPTVTPEPTPAVQPQPVQAPVQPIQPKVQATPQPITPTPEVKPTEIKPVTPTATPEKTTTVPQVDFNVSQGREGEIQKNIADITATNPNLLKDRNAYNQAFGYETADQ